MALQRRLPEDDQWVVPHNIYLAMFSPSSVNVLAFDPCHGADQARGYAGKYCSKPERFYFMESETNGVKCWLKARTIGLCAAFNRLLHYHCVRSTKPVTFLPSDFVRQTAYSSVRSEGHLQKFLEYPDPLFHLSPLGIYYFRNGSLLHLRIEQYNRYLLVTDRADDDAYRGCGVEPDDDYAEDTSRFVETDHRHHDAFMEGQPPGKTYAARWKGVASAKRRLHSRLGVSRTQWFEPIGQTRESFYQQKLVLGLPWFADGAPQLVETAGAKRAVSWVLKWARPSSLAAYDLPDIALEISSAGSSFSYEERCHHYDNLFSSSTLNIVCRCCDGEIDQGPCDACRYAVGFHVCKKSGVSQHRWRRTTLFGGQLDVQRCIFNLHRRQFPIDVIRSKSQEYIDAGLISEQMAQVMVRTIEVERGGESVANERHLGLDEGEGGGAGEDDRPLAKLNARQLSELLQTRERQMQQGGVDGETTDRWRVYNEIVHSLTTERRLRIMVQASAGTGKSFLLTSLFLWCVVHGMACKAAAPTGIAAANIEIDGTDVCAATLHSVFDLDSEYKSNLDFAKPGIDKVAAILRMKAAAFVYKCMLCVSCRQRSASDPSLWHGLRVHVRREVLFLDEARPGSRGHRCVCA